MIQRKKEENEDNRERNRRRKKGGMERYRDRETDGQTDRQTRQTAFSMNMWAKTSARWRLDQDSFHSVLITF